MCITANVTGSTVTCKIFILLPKLLLLNSTRHSTKYWFSKPRLDGDVRHGDVRGIIFGGWLIVFFAHRGFGNTMANSPMVIMWPNSDGTITLSQRLASSEVMPTVVSSPPRVATLSTSLSSVRYFGRSVSYVRSLPPPLTD
jgi:hypothetical protein